MKPYRVWPLLLAWGLMGVAVVGPAEAAKKKESSGEKGNTKKDVGGDGPSHVVKRGETLWGIARKHEVSVGELMDLNHMANDSVHEGQVLRIPQPGDSTPQPGMPAPPTTHTVAKGDTLRSIAKAHGITQDELEHANPKVDPDHLKIGAKLKLPAKPADPAAEKAAPETTTQNKYTVRERDTYTSIAKEHGLTVSGIAKANPNVSPERLRPGMQLVLPAKAKAEKSSAKKKDEEGEDKPAKSRGTHAYTVSEGETLRSIAEAFNISARRLCEINGVSSLSELRDRGEVQVPNQ